MALADEILGDLKKVKGKGKAPPFSAKNDAADEPDEDDEESAEGGDEEMAMQEFMDAESPAEKVTALKSFMRICYPNLGE